jgi:hypothetical protein
MGPRPIFVKTAYADAPAVTVQATIAMDVAGEAAALPELAAEAPAALDAIH